MALSEADPLSVREAASRLDVHPSRIGAMLREGVLDGQKVGGRWLVNRRSVEQRRCEVVLSGRPYSPSNAWALINLWEGKPAPWVSRWERSRLRRRLREEGLEKLEPRLRSRASRELFRSHPAGMSRLASEPSLVLSGVSAAAEHGIDILAPNELEAYVIGDELPKLVEKYHLRHSSRPNVILHVVDDLSWVVREAKVVGPAVAALDLMEADDEKSRRAGKEFLNDPHQNQGTFG